MCRRQGGAGGGLPLSSRLDPEKLSPIVGNEGRGGRIFGVQHGCSKVRLQAEPSDRLQIWPLCLSYVEGHISNLIHSREACSKLCLSAASTQPY